MPFVSYMLSKSCCSKYKKGIRSGIELHQIQCWKKSFLLKHRPTPLQWLKTCMLEPTQSNKLPWGYLAALRCRPHLCPSQYSGPGHTHKLCLRTEVLVRCGESMLLAEELGAVVCSHSPILGYCEEAVPVHVHSTLCLTSVCEEQPLLLTLRGCVGLAAIHGL